MQWSAKNGRDGSGAVRICALYLSLNTPVVALDDFPVGPARAGVALSEGSDRGLQLEIAVRSVRTGQLRFYCSDEEIAVDGATVEAALSFSEGMGFLFDEDEVASRGAEGERESAVLWRELVGDFPGASLEPVPKCAREVRVGGLPAPVAAVEGGRASAARSGAPRLALSKFRLVLGAPEAEAAVRNRLLSRF
jgi:hypothetical protein